MLPRVMRNWVEHLCLTLVPLGASLTVQTGQPSACHIRLFLGIVVPRVKSIRETRSAFPTGRLTPMSLHP